MMALWAWDTRAAAAVSMRRRHGGGKAAAPPRSITAAQHALGMPRTALLKGWEVQLQSKGTLTSSGQAACLVVLP